MTCATIVRGATVQFTATFYAPDGTQITPASATTLVYYTVSGSPTTATVNMTSDSTGTWTGDWASGPADAGNVDWFTTSSGPPYATQEGSFTLSANLANPQS